MALNGNFLTRWVHEHRRFWFLFMLVAILRFGMLFSAQTHLHSDEAIIGIMARHIAAGKEFPAYFYGQAYNGGAAVEAFLAAGLFIFLGATPVALKAVIVLLSLLTLAVFYFMVGEFWGRQVALTTSLLFALSPTLLKWHFQVRGAYAEWLLLGLLLLWLVFRQLSIHAPSKNLLFGIGLCAGFGLYCVELLLPLVLILLGVLLFRRRDLFSSKAAWFGVLGFLAGYYPALHFNLEHRWANWKYLLSRTGKTSLLETISSLSTWKKVLFAELPRFFGSDTVFWYYPNTSIAGWFWYLFFLISCGFIIGGLYQRKRRKETEKGLLPQREGTWHPEPLLLLIAFSVLVPYMKVSIRVPGYLLFLIPMLSIFGGLFLQFLLSHQSASARNAGILVLVLAISLSLNEMVTFGRFNHIDSMALDSSGKLYPRKYSGKNLDEALVRLRQHEVKAVMASSSFQYAIIFESGEKILASSRLFPLAYTVHPPYESAMERVISERPVTLIERASPFRPMVENYYQRTFGPDVQVEEFEDLVLYLPQK